MTCLRLRRRGALLPFNPHRGILSTYGGQEMDEFEKGSVIQWYELLEDRLLEVLSFVPPDGSNLSVHSPRIAGILLEACGLLDSVFRESAPDPAMVGGNQVPKDELTMSHYEPLFGGAYNLPNYPTYVLISPPQVRCPFSAWAQGAHLAWWNTYNRVKHNRIANLRKATMDTAMEAMCALHQVLTRVPEFAEAVLRHHWLKCKTQSPRFALELVRRDPKWASVPFLLGSKLFLTGGIGDQPLPARLEDFIPNDYSADDSILDFFASLAR